MKFEEHIQG